MNIKFICVDFQKDFSDEKGKWFNHGTSVNFIKNDFIKFLNDKNIKINEIISDYRAPRPGKRGIGCVPGTFGYESDIPDFIKNKDVWIKCMNSPIWVRNNIGDEHKQPGIPYQDPNGFNDWLNRNIGLPEDVDLIILFGLTMDCCVLCTAQELNFRGYKVKMLYEAVDSMDPTNLEYKKQLSEQSPILTWTSFITFEELKNLIGN